MPNNKRIFYACQAVGISEMNVSGTPDIHVLHGVQSVGVNTAFNLEQVFELGQLEIYENIEGIPEVEVTLEKVLDGYPLIYTAATCASEDKGFLSAGGHGLSQRANNQCCVHLGIFDETFNTVSNVNATTQVYMSGMYVSNVSYTFPTDGNMTESVTLAGNHKEWASGNIPARLLAATTSQLPGSGTGSSRIGQDQPSASGVTGTKTAVGVARRENFNMASSIVPKSIIKATSPNLVLANISETVGNGYDSASKTNKVHIQSATVSTDFGREDIFELGRKFAYYRPATFPIEVTCELEVLSNSGDFVSALEDGDPGLRSNIRTSGNNTSDETIKLVINNGYEFDLGSRNRLSSINFAGGDAGGGNATMTFSYTNFNDLQVIDSNSGLLV
ncbi:hypothetical protein EBQ93_02210 [bacterium]|nr:hypothetical protein [bacterium]